MEKKFSAEHKKNCFNIKYRCQRRFQYLLYDNNKAKYTHIWFKEKMRCFLSFFFFWSTAKHLIAAISTKFIHKRYFGLIASNFVRVQEFYISRFMKPAKLWPKFHTRANVMNGTTAFDDA